MIFNVFYSGYLTYCIMTMQFVHLSPYIMSAGCIFQIVHKMHYPPEGEGASHYDAFLHYFLLYVFLYEKQSLSEVFQVIWINSELFLYLVYMGECTTETRTSLLP